MLIMRFMVNVRLRWVVMGSDREVTKSAEL